MWLMCFLMKWVVDSLRLWNNFIVLIIIIFFNFYYLLRKCKRSFGVIKNVGVNEVNWSLVEREGKNEVIGFFICWIINILKLFNILCYEKLNILVYNIIFL